MKLFERQDQRFAEQAVDAAKREAAIKTYAKLQTVLLWLTLPAIVIAAGAMLFSSRSGSGLGLLGVVIINLMIFNKLDSDRKLLLVLQRLDSK